ncbi:MAG: hypothetical protein U0802_25095 [Candidatus Binatia bacterium]
MTCAKRKIFRHLQADNAEAGIEEPYFFGNHPQLAERIEHYQALVAAHALPLGGEPRVDHDELTSVLLSPCSTMPEWICTWAARCGLGVRSSAIWRRLRPAVPG